MQDEDRAEHLWRALNSCLGMNRDVTLATVTHWLEHHGAGFPDVPLMQEQIRADAKLWATSASQAELESYAAAAIMELEKSPITGKAAKRMTALGFKKMDPEQRIAFKNWVEGQ